MDLGFLPQLPLPTSGLVLFGALLLIGLVGGVLARKISLPAISGYTLVGVLLGQTGLGLLTPALLAEARVFVDISLGMILFDLGRRLDFKWLRHDRTLLYAGISESALSFVLIYVALYYFGLPLLMAAIAAAIGIAASPAVIMLIAHENRAEGQVTERALNLVAMNSVFAFITVTMLLSALHFEYRASVITILLHPLYLLVGSLALGVIAWYVTVQVARWLGKREEHQFVILIGMVVITVGIAASLKLSVLLSLLAFGVLIKNFDAHHRVLPIELAGKGDLFFVVLFVVTGAVLDAKQLLFGGTVGFVYLTARFFGKMLGVMPWALIGGLDRRRAISLGLTLTPMAGFTVVIVQDVWALYPELDPQIFSILTSAVVLLEIIGPIVVQFTLRWAGETQSRGP